MGILYIGTSGYNYAHWKGIVYSKDLPQKDWLTFYSNIFPSIEINATFYRLFERSVFEKWYQKTAHNFRFAVKGSGLITHRKRLSDIGDDLHTFYRNMSGLEEKLSVILWQFPSSFIRINRNEYRLVSFIKLLKKTRHAIEFRDDSWFTEETYKLLNSHNIGWVINDSSVFPSAKKQTADFVYIRLHGPGQLYASSYTENQLQIWAHKIKGLLKRGDVYCYFNNDSRGYAVDNAQRLRRMVEHK